MKTIGRHLIAEFYGCDRGLANELGFVRQSMLDAATGIGATVVGDAFHQFSPQGVSGSVVIAESHLSIHTWPESGYLAVDIYTCGGLHPHAGLEHIGRVFGAKSMRVQEILRGLPEDLEAGREWSPNDVSVITHMGPVTNTRLD